MSELKMVLVRVKCNETGIFHWNTVNVQKPNVQFDKPNKKVFRFQTFGFRTFGWLPLNRTFGSTKLDHFI